MGGCSGSYVCVLHDASGPGLIRVLITVGPALWGRDTHLSDISYPRRGAADFQFFHTVQKSS